jgi:formiminotetrahydrofolate cyclodeaminase
MTLTERSFVDLLRAFRSPEPTPGGGSAAALAGAVGASLLAMVSGLPKPRTATGEDASRLAAAGQRCADLSVRLAELVDRDSEAYEGVLQAFRLPKATDDEKARRTARIQEALQRATTTPLEVMRACGAAIEQGAVVAAFGSRNAASDVHVGLELLGAGLRGARLNVDVNLPGVKDAEWVRRIAGESEALATAGARGIDAARTALEGPTG